MKSATIKYANRDLSSNVRLMALVEQLDNPKVHAKFHRHGLITIEGSEPTEVDRVFDRITEAICEEDLI